MKNYLLAFSTFLLFGYNIIPAKTEFTPPVFEILRFDKTDKTFKDSIKGELTDGLSWKDTEGENRVLFTIKPVEMNKDGLQSGALYAYCFTKTATGWKKKWEVKDRVDDCEVDATCEFFPNSFTITDNDRNNTGEVTFLYRLSCKGDVSPDEKKLIMYEGTKKYAIRGSTILHLPEEKLGGEKRIDPSFTKAAKTLLDFANKQWDKFGIVKY